MKALSVKDYVEHLYTPEMEGYIEVTQDFYKFKRANISNIESVLEEFKGLENIYISPNTFFIKQRRVANIRHLRALYLDLDLSLNRDGMSKTEIVYEVFILAAKGIIPKPSLIVDSGRGIHLYWKIEHAPKGALSTWQQLQDYLYNKLKDLGADRKATDAARVLRLPGSVNKKNGQVCKVLHVNNDVIYSMYDLREEFLEYSKKINKRKKNSNKKESSISNKINHIFNSYTLHISRIQDVETLCVLRDWDVKGYRNSILHCWIYWTGIVTRDTEELLEIALEFNQNLLEPQKTSEIRAIVRSCSKAIEKFIDYQDNPEKTDIESSFSKNGYWYKNSTLIEMLNISEYEQKHLKTIISVKEKYRRNNIRRKKIRRNENGLTSREQSKENTITSVLSLYAKGLKQSEISKDLGLSKSTVSKVINKKY